MHCEKEIAMAAIKIHLNNCTKSTDTSSNLKEVSKQLIEEILNSKFQC